MKPKVGDYILRVVEDREHAEGVTTHHKRIYLARWNGDDWESGRVVCLREKVHEEFGPPEAWAVKHMRRSLFGLLSREMMPLPDDPKDDEGETT